MFSLQYQAERLIGLTEDVIAEKNTKFQGIVKVFIEDLVFAPDFTPCDYNVSSAKVSRLKRIFKTEGCNRSDPSNFITGTIAPDVLEEAMRLSNLTSDDFQDREELPVLYLPRFQYIRCAYGRSRVKALSDMSRLGRWWTIELHSDLTEEKRWWARLTKSAANILKRLLKHEAFAPPFLKLIINIPGLREGFEIGPWNKIIGAKCDEEVVRYMEFTFESWVSLMGSEEALSYVDPEDVREFQLRVPGVSQLDFHHLASLIMNGDAFKRLENRERRKELITRLSRIKYLIPSIHTLQKDFKYLRLCTDTLKQLTHGNDKPPGTAQTLAFDAFSSKTSMGPDSSFFEKMKCLYLAIMRDLVELTGEWPLLEDGEKPPESCVPLPASWHRLATEARRLGFHSDEITRLASEDPDEKVALRALCSARPISTFEYNDSELQSMVKSIVAALGQARDRTSNGIDAALTTTGIGEPIPRRCGRQYSGAYARDRWSFNIAKFSCPTPESTDITSLFVRRSVFHAFWRIEEIHDDNTAPAEPEDEPMPPPETELIFSSENESMYSQVIHASVEPNDQPMPDRHSPRQSSYKGQRFEERDGRKTQKLTTRQRLVRQKSKAKRGQSKRPSKRLLARLKPAIQPATESLAVQQQSTNQQQLVPVQTAPVRVSMAEEPSAIPTPTLDLIRPLARSPEMMVFEFIQDGLGGGSWKEHTCRRELVSELIQELKTHFKQGVEFYHQREPRTIAEQELPQYDAICIAPRDVAFREGHFPAEEEY
ncbi:hypothetical protein FALBO_17112 [Fusarium albosuccineum]|uniref:Uncharacterized protein n=1 Tax=Fusarium albosuccineum TaxID=1237068 RepID=A0A8H4K7D2_9HYPO|nr:hypothetical protein FALBO_17112 [Fusarium albosuccineum]